jgi:hypothetical protein
MIFFKLFENSVGRRTDRNGLRIISKLMDKEINEEKIGNRISWWPERRN